MPVLYSGSHVFHSLAACCRARPGSVTAAASAPAPSLTFSYNAFIRGIRSGDDDAQKVHLIIAGILCLPWIFLALTFLAALISRAL